MRHPDPDARNTERLAAHLAERRAAFGKVSTTLSLLSDHRLGEVVAAATPLGSGIGGRSAELDIDGTRVFVKRVPLTDLETRPENLRSTANLFGLPMYYQYGVGSSGFGAWRELAVHTMTTNWVLTGADGDTGAYEGFPLMYHWRVLPDSAPSGTAEAFGSINAAVARWEGSSAVRERLEAIERSSAGLALFLEYVPWTLAAWLDGRADHYPWVAETLARGTSFMRSRGLVHFDAHFNNVLTDGHTLYFADFGLALSTGFELAPREQEFLTEHLAYDHWYTVSHLLRFHLRKWIADRPTADIPPEITALAERHARPAAIMDDFFDRLITESKQTPFPAAELEGIR
ncbi:protein kinase family protein [Streptomyces albicerus]|uniref:protein kinase family protein n=1 Tax=Streptomyces albicerus TaxID=2569859 RepID=UPI001CEC3338|nr:protein kinase family protein [Streptomyces albicerus]